jgi:hypothetical protein
LKCAARRDATSQNNRFVRADAVRDQLLTVDAVLVWVDPIHQGKTRAALDPMSS